MRLLLAFRNIRPYISTGVNTMQCLMSLHQTLQGNKRKTKSPARHREAYRSRLVRLGCEVMEDRVLLSAALPDYHFTAPALVAGTAQTQHNAPSSIGSFTKNPGGTTYRSVSNGSMQAVVPAAPSFTATAVSATQINLAWKPVAGATGYLVDEWINSVWKQIGSLGSGSTGYAVTGLSPNTTYYLDVAAYNAAGSTWANYRSATTYVSPPSTPIDAVVSVQNSSSHTITFGFRWTSSSSWTLYTEAPGQSEIFWTTYSSSLSPQVLYDTSSAPNSQTDCSLTQGYNQWTGTGTPPASAAKPYAFENTTTGVQLCYAGGSTGPAPASNAVTNPNWSGYVAETNLSQPQPNSVTEVSGSWIVPKVTGPSTGSTYSSIWVGIDGYGNSTVEQLGTEEDVVNGSPVYRAWWEMISSGKGQPEQVITGMTVMPGDSITASVQYIMSGAHVGQFDLSIVDNSRPNDSFSIYASSSQYQSPLAQRSSAEWIVEATTVGGNIATVPNFGSVTFTNATAVISGVSGPINAASWHSQALNIGSNGVTYDTTSVLTNSGTSFVVTYNPSAGAAVRAGTNAAAGTASGTAVGTTLRSGKTVAGPVLRGSAWTGASVVSGFRTPIGQHKRPTQGFLMDPLWN